VQSGKAEEFVQLVQRSIVPAVKRQRGYRGIYSLIDRKNGKGMIISLWDSEAVAVVNEQSGYYHEQVAKLTPYLSQPAVREGYEVAVQN
jgi:heme-degrading monooxygenase HmoA